MEIEKEIYDLWKNVEIERQRLTLLLEMSTTHRQLQKEAMEKAEASMNKRLEGMNEFRAQLEKQSTTFVTVKEIDLMKDALELLVKQAEIKLEEKAKANAERIKNIESIQSNWAGRFYIISIIWGVVLLVIAWYLNHH